MHPRAPRDPHRAGEQRSPRPRPDLVPPAPRGAPALPRRRREVRETTYETHERAAHTQNADAPPPQTLEDQEDAPPPAQRPAAAAGGDSGGAKQNRAEKKNRKAMQKLGMKAVPGVVRVTVKKSKNILFAIGHPYILQERDVGHVYVVTGEAKIEDLSAQAQQQAASVFQAAQASMGAGAAAAAAPPTIPRRTRAATSTRAAWSPRTTARDGMCDRARAARSVLERSARTTAPIVNDDHYEPCKGGGARNTPGRALSLS